MPINFYMIKIANRSGLIQRLKFEMKNYKSEMVDFAKINQVMGFFVKPENLWDYFNIKINLLN